MRYAIPMQQSMVEALKDRNARYLKVSIIHAGSQVDIFPLKFQCSASTDFQKWTIILKNRGEYVEGLFAGESVVVLFSHDRQSWVQMFTGYVSPQGMSRTFGFVTDDVVSMELVDLTRSKGVKRYPSKAVYAGLKVCDPSDPDNSILHRLASQMGITALDVSAIPHVKDIVELGDNTVWNELKLLRDAYAAAMYFDHLGRLRFRSFLDADWTGWESEWTFVADPSVAVGEKASGVLGKIKPTYNEVSCTRATGKVDVYVHRSTRTIFRDTTEWNADLGQCHIEIAPGATYPGTGVASLNYQDPDTGEEYPYATDVQAPGIGQNDLYDIAYSGGSLELVSFNGSTPDTAQEPGASQIILRNAGSQTCIVTKLTIRGKPFVLEATQEVQETDASVIDETDHVDVEVDGKYAASAVQLDMPLARLVAKGKIRTRHFELQSTFLPHVQRGMGCTLVLPGGESVACEIATYAHKVVGNTLATARTDVVLDEITAFIPVYNPSIVNGKPGTVVPKKGEQGDPGEDAYQIQILSEQGTTFRMGQEFTTTMHARVWQGSEEITDLFSDSDFRWTRTSSDTHADEVWNSAHYSTGSKSLVITQEDVVGRSNFFCELLRERSS